MIIILKNDTNTNTNTNANTNTRPEEGELASFYLIDPCMFPHAYWLHGDHHSADRSRYMVFWSVASPLFGSGRQEWHKRRQCPPQMWFEVGDAKRGEQNAIRWPPRTLAWSLYAGNPEWSRQEGKHTHGILECSIPLLRQRTARMTQMKTMPASLLRSHESNFLGNPVRMY